MSNQRRIWNDPKVREERLPAAEKKLGRPMEMEPIGEWIPPTDAERVMFQNLAKNALDFGVPFDDIGAEFCHREGVDFEDFARIAESLAMDGL